MWKELCFTDGGGAPSTQVLTFVWAQYIGANREMPVRLEHSEWGRERDDELREIERRKISPFIGFYFNSNRKTLEVFK